MNGVVQKIAGIVIISCCSIPAIAQKSFKPPEIITATDVQSPINSIASGIVVLDVSLDSEGDVTKIDVPRPIASLTAPALAAVKTWKFRPASPGAIPSPAVLRIAFAFRPRALGAAPPVFKPLAEPNDTSSDSRAGYIPPGITAAAYPSYPFNAATVGAVVVQVSLDQEGRVSDVAPILAFNQFTRLALEAAKKWSFRPATFDGTRIPSKLVIAFVFAPPNYHE